MVVQFDYAVHLATFFVFITTIYVLYRQKWLIKFFFSKNSEILNNFPMDFNLTITNINYKTSGSQEEPAMFIGNTVINNNNKTIGYLVIQIPLFVIEKIGDKVIYVDSSLKGRGVRYGEFDITDPNFPNNGAFRLNLN